MKSSFVLYTDYLPQIELLNNEQRGILLTAVMRYASALELPEMDGITSMAFSFIKANMDKDNEKYERMVKARQEAGKSGGRPKANGFFEKQTKAKKANGFFEKQNNPDNDNDNDNVNDNDSNLIDTDVSICHTGTVQRIVEAWNTIADKNPAIPKITKMARGSKRYNSLMARVKEYGENEVLTAIRNIEDSRFLRGENGWVIKFDWFVLPNNFPKVLEGNYADNKPQKKDHVRGQYDFYESDWTDLLRDNV